MLVAKSLSVSMLTMSLSILYVLIAWTWYIRRYSYINTLLIVMYITIITNIM